MTGSYVQKCDNQLDRFAVQDDRTDGGRCGCRWRRTARAAAGTTRIGRFHGSAVLLMMTMLMIAASDCPDFVLCLSPLERNLLANASFVYVLRLW